YTGGTTVTAGTLQVSPQAAGVNPLSSGTVTLAGSGGTNQAYLAFRQFLPVGTVGYNNDVIWSAAESPTATQAVTFPFDGGQTFFAQGVAGATSLPGGMPTIHAVNALGTGQSGTIGTTAPLV